MAPTAAPLKIVTPRRTIILLIVACTLFAAMGVVVLVLAPDKLLNQMVGIGAIGFFGVGGGLSIVLQWRRSVALRADDDGIRLGDGGRIPWADVDRIGSTSTQLGIRLRRYDGFLASLPRKTRTTAESLRASRAHSGGWDLTWETHMLDRAPGVAARDLQRRRPS